MFTPDREQRDRVPGPFLARLGSGLGPGLGFKSGLGVGLDLHAYLDPTTTRFLARKRMRYVNSLPP